MNKLTYKNFRTLFSAGLSGQRKPQRPARSRVIALVMSALMVAPYSMALPSGLDMTDIIGNSDYTIVGSEGTLEISQDRSVIEVADGGVNVGNTETLNFTHTGGNSAWSVLVRDLSGSASAIDGALNGDIRVFLVNQNGIVFGATSQLGLASLVASTYDGNFNGDTVEFVANGSSGSIDVEGLTSAVADGQVMLVSSDINIDGQVNLNGNLDMVAGESVVVSFSGNDLMQFNITQALQTTSSDRIFSVDRGSETNAANVTMEGNVSDPRSLVVNNRGIIRANGINTSTPGVIRLVGNGGRILSTGTLDTSSANGDGDIELAGGSVVLRGNIDAGTGELNAIVGQNGDEGLFAILSGTDITADAATITAVGTNNGLIGLANYTVASLDSGTAGLQGVGSTDWSNTSAVSFSNFSMLTATSAVDNTIQILDGAGLSENTLGEDSVTGGGLNDTFVIVGSLPSANGAGGNDRFEMQGGTMSGQINGGADNDIIINVIGVETFDNNNQPDPNGANGQSDFVNWVSVEDFFESQLPPTTDDPSGPVLGDPTPGILVQQIPVDDVSGLGDVSLGLVADDNNLRLPCGHNTERDFVTEEERLAAAEADCFNRYGGPEYQKLISSIIHFDNDSHAITAASANRLDRVSAFVVESEMFDKIVLSGHTDDNGSVAYNMKLSERRSNAAADYMSSKGVDVALMEQHYFGESLPGRPNDSDENRAFNRRVHIDLKR